MTFNYFGFVQEMGVRQLLTADLRGANVRYEGGQWMFAKTMDSKGFRIGESAAKRLINRLSKEDLASGDEPLTNEELADDHLFWLQNREEE
jgi:hypothetical protein